MVSLLDEGQKGDVDVSFTISGMPLQVFKKFKNYAKDWRDNYSVTIQVLMDKVETFEYMMGAGEDVEVEHEEVKAKDVVETLGDEE